MSLTREDLEEIFGRLKTIERLALKVWRKKQYRTANSINWEVQIIKDMIQRIIGQQE